VLLVLFILAHEGEEDVQLFLLKHDLLEGVVVVEQPLERVLLGGVEGEGLDLLQLLELGTFEQLDVDQEVFAEFGLQVQEDRGVTGC